ncbi:MFS transporter [Aquabacterium parvum]|uniref:MFS transporter n=1 Tax=Aquabacterium parvum TaxID=70584 RepID=UPI000718FF14|nr:MFS transporter [Aquabacterium parvum]
MATSMTPATTVPAASPHGEHVGPPTHAASPWPVFFTACIAVFLVSVDATVLFAAFAALRLSFAGTSAADLSWVLNAYTVLYAALLVPAGRLADTHGRRRMFIAGTGLFMLASLACGLASDVTMLVAARSVQAVGAAVLTPASLSIVLGAFPASRRAVAVSLWGAVGGLAAALGPSLGSLLVDTLGWRWAFFINVPPALWAIWRARRRLPVDAVTSGAGQIDFLGVALLVLGMGGLTAGVVATESHTWHQPQVWLAALTGAASLLAFVRWARRHPAPALDLSLFANRTYSAVNLATLVFGIAFSMMFFGFFFFMTGIWHYSLPQAGLAITPGPLMVIPVAMLAGRIAASAGHRPLLVTGCLLVASGGVWQATVPGLQPHYLLHWLPGQLLTGVGVGLALPSLSGAAVASLGPAHFGAGSAVNQAMRQFGSVVGVALTVVLLGDPSLQLASFQRLSWVYSGLACLTALLCLPVRTKPKA